MAVQCKNRLPMPFGFQREPYLGRTWPSDYIGHVRDEQAMAYTAGRVFIHL